MDKDTLTRLRVKKSGAQSQVACLFKDLKLFVEVSFGMVQISERRQPWENLLSTCHYMYVHNVIFSKIFLIFRICPTAHPGLTSRHKSSKRGRLRKWVSPSNPRWGRHCDRRSPPLLRVRLYSSQINILKWVCCLNNANFLYKTLLY